MSEFQGVPSVVDEAEALKLIQGSPWARRKCGIDSRTINWVTGINAALASRDTRESDDRLFVRWCKTALSQFEIEKPDAISRGQNGEKSYIENAILAWLDARYEELAIEKFGRP